MQKLNFGIRIKRKDKGNSKEESMNYEKKGINK